MSRPTVELDNSDAVYDFYLKHRPNRWRAKAICASMARRYRPRVFVDDGVKQQLAELFRKTSRLSSRSTTRPSATRT